MQVSIATDYAADTGPARDCMRRIAEAGFTHIHWCHEWNTPHVYSSREIAQIANWLDDVGLDLLDLHASSPETANWLAPEDARRRAGLDLLRNRIEMTRALGADTVVVHLTYEPSKATTLREAVDRVRRSMDEIEPHCREHRVALAVENMGGDTYRVTGELLAHYEPNVVGICYDSGHGNLDGRGLDHLNGYKDRLIAVHLHDNDGTDDQHRLPGMDTVDWQRLTRIVAASSYTKPLNLEVSMRSSGYEDEDLFLRKAFEAVSQLTRQMGNPA